jgi:hypothetical protein
VERACREYLDYKPLELATMKTIITELTIEDIERILKWFYFGIYFADCEYQTGPYDEELVARLNDLKDKIPDD